MGCGRVRQTMAGGLVALVAFTLAGPVQAAPPDPLAVAVPFYTAAAYLQGLAGQHHLPLAVRFDDEAGQLVSAVQQVCQKGGGARARRLTTARARWTSTLAAWSSLSAVSIGPLLTRRSARQIDFQPTRPALIARAIAQGPSTVQELEAVGSPAKGLPALEWLLWSSPIQPAQPPCRYAELVARDLAREARALRQAFEGWAERDWQEDPEQAATVMAEVVNQWLGAVEALRWREMGKPLASALQGGNPVFSRPWSGQAQVAWTAQWQAIRALGVLQGDRVPAPGTDLVPLETFARGRGVNPVADALVASVIAVDTAMVPLRPRGRPQPPRTPQVAAAVTALGQLKQVIEAQLAPALQVSIGFSDADGD